MRLLLQRQLSSWDQELESKEKAAPVGLIIRHLMLLKHMTRLYEGRMIVTVAAHNNLVDCYSSIIDHQTSALE